MNLKAKAQVLSNKENVFNMKQRESTKDQFLTNTCFSLIGLAFCSSNYSQCGLILRVV